MKPNKFYLLEVWVITTFLIALVCACWPDISTYPITMLPKSLPFSIGIFLGIIVFELEYSIAIFICLYLLFYLMTVKFNLSEIVVKSVLIVFFLVGIFIANHIYFSWTWLHPFFKVYLAGAAGALIMFDVYKLDLEYDD